MAIWAEQSHALFTPDGPDANLVDAFAPQKDWGWV